MEGFMMNVDGNCCERLTVTLSHWAKALPANAPVPKSAKGCLVPAKKKQKAKRMARTMAWPLTLGHCMGGNAARTGM